MYFLNASPPKLNSFRADASARRSRVEASAPDCKTLLKNRQADEHMLAILKQHGGPSAPSSPMIRPRPSATSWPPIAKKATELLARIAANDRELEHINTQA